MKPASGILNVCVVGSTGFLGTAVVSALHARGLKVVCPSVRNKVADEEYWIEFERTLERLEVDALINCAVARLRSNSIDTQRMVREVNVSLPVRLARVASELNVGFMQVGSRWQLGERGEGPNGFYASAKEEGELLARDVITQSGGRMRVPIIRDTYGEADSRDNLMCDLLEASRTGQRVELTNGEQLVDVAKVTRVAVSVVDWLCLPWDGPKYERREVGSDSPPTVRKLVDLFREASGRPLKTAWGSRPYRGLELYSMERVYPWLPGWNPDLWLAEFNDFVRQQLRD